MKKLLPGLLLLAACSKSHVNKMVVTPANPDYSTNGTHIQYKGNNVQFIGADALHVFSAGGTDMTAWNIDVVREFIGNMQQQPLSGAVIKDANGAYLYPLQTVVDSNAKYNRITILCPFGWDGSGTSLFTGTMPQQTSWWASYKTQLAQWAAFFKNDPNVWIEVWNEPYRYDGADGATDATWQSDMSTMVNIIRSAGNNNIILVPCAKQGQDETVLNDVGQTFLAANKNILFDIHAYERWLLDANASVGTRLQALKQRNLPVIFGETAPMNAGTLMNPQFFLDSAYNRGLSICAWVWKNDGTDQDALLDSNGAPNNTNNNNWGSLYQSYTKMARKP